MAVIMIIHDVFPPDNKPGEDPILLKMLKSRKVHGPCKAFSRLNELIIDALLRCSRKQWQGIVFSEFESITAKLYHIFILIPTSKGLLPQ